MNWLGKLAEVEEKKARGEQLHKSGEWEKARHQLEEGLEALETCYKTQKIALIERLDDVCTCLVDKNMQAGDNHLTDGSIEAARECYKIALDAARSPRVRDEILIKLGQLDQREAPSENLEKLAKRCSDNPDSPEALYDLATELALEGYLQEAISNLQKLAEMTPDDADVFYRLGNALRDGQRWDDARVAYEKALALEFEDKAEIHYRLGCLELDGVTNPYEAKKQFRRALEIKPDHVETLKRMARLNKLEENYEGSIECILSALKYEADDAGLWLELGDLHEASGHSEKAKEYWAKAIEVEPDGDAADYAREKIDDLESKEEEASRQAAGDR